MRSKLLLISLTLLFFSCTKSIDEFLKEQFYEPANLSTTITVDGDIAAPLLNTSLGVKNFITSFKDSTAWLEVDNEQLLHLKIKFDSIVQLTAQEIFKNCPIPPVVNPDSFSIKTDTQKIFLYEKALGGNVTFNDPKLILNVKNKIPLVTFFKVDSVYFRSEAYDQTYSGEVKKFYIEKPNDPNQTAYTQIIIDKNALPIISQLLSPVPYKFFIKATTGSDAVQTYNPALFPDICSRTLIADLILDLPFNLTIKDFIMSDTLPFSLGIKKEDLKFIDSVKLKIFIENELPVGLLINSYLADTTPNGYVNQSVFNIFSNWSLNPATVNTSGVSISTVRSSYIRTLTVNEVKQLIDKNPSRIVLSAKMNTTNSINMQQVKILGTNKLKVKIGIKISYNANTSQF